VWLRSVEFAATTAPEASRVERLTPAMARAARLNALRKSDPLLATAIDLLDLELLD
jgi:hypothetical protein